MSFDEQPDPLSDCMEAYDKLKTALSRQTEALKACQERCAGVEDKLEYSERCLLETRIQRNEAHSARLWAQAKADELEKKSVGLRFWAKVDKTDDCWNWKGRVSTNGYGSFWLERKLQTAHRVAWRLSGRSLEPHLVLDHLCRNRKCVNPDHLEDVTQKENMRRGLVGKKTECVHGHPFTAENTVINKDGTRRCRTCKRGYDRKEKANAMP